MQESREQNDTNSIMPCSQLLHCIDACNSPQSPCHLPRVLQELPTVELNKRAKFLSQAGTASVEELNSEICGEISSVELNNNLSRKEIRSGINVTFFNLERGKFWKESVDRLKSANIILLNEVDYGMARTGNGNVAKLLAQELGKNYVLGVEFLELTNGLPEEIVATANETNHKGFHCNAILSDFPLHSPSMLRLPDADIWFKPQSGSKTEVRLGSRMLLRSKVEVNEQNLWLAVTHLDGTRGQFDSVSKGLLDIAYAEPLIFAGDLHAEMPDVPRLLGSTGLNFELNEKAKLTPTWGYGMKNGRVQVVKGWDHGHLIGVRGISTSDVTVSPPVGPRGELLSDSAFVEFRTVLGVD